MVALLLAILMILATGVMVVGFSCWALLEHRDAKKYRGLIAIHNATPKVKQGGWKVIYKVDKKTLVAYVDGKTEKEALRAFQQSYKGYNSIDLLERNP